MITNLYTLLSVFFLIFASLSAAEKTGIFRALDFEGLVQAASSENEDDLKPYTSPLSDSNELWCLECIYKTDYYAITRSLTFALNLAIFGPVYLDTLIVGCGSDISNQEGIHRIFARRVFVCDAKVEVENREIENESSAPEEVKFATKPATLLDSGMIVASQVIIVAKEAQENSTEPSTSRIHFELCSGPRSNSFGFCRYLNDKNNVEYKPNVNYLYKLKFINKLFALEDSDPIEKTTLKFDLIYFMNGDTALDDALGKDIYIDEELLYSDEQEQLNNMGALTANSFYKEVNMALHSIQDYKDNLKQASNDDYILFAQFVTLNLESRLRSSQIKSKQAIKRVLEISSSLKESDKNFLSSLHVLQETYTELMNEALEKEVTEKLRHEGRKAIKANITANAGKTGKLKMDSLEQQRKTCQSEVQSTKKRGYNSARNGKTVSGKTGNAEKKKAIEDACIANQKKLIEKHLNETLSNNELEVKIDPEEVKRRVAEQMKVHENHNVAGLGSAKLFFSKLSSFINVFTVDDNVYPIIPERIDSEVIATPPQMIPEQVTASIKIMRDKSYAIFQPIFSYANSDSKHKNKAYEFDNKLKFCLENRLNVLKLVREALDLQNGVWALQAEADLVENMISQTSSAVVEANEASNADKEAVMFNAMDSLIQTYVSFAGKVKALKNFYDFKFANSESSSFTCDFTNGTTDSLIDCVQKLVTVKTDGAQTSVGTIQPVTFIICDEMRHPQQLCDHVDKDFFESLRGSGSGEFMLQAPRERETRFRMESITEVSVNLPELASPNSVRSLGGHIGFPVLLENDGFETYLKQSEDSESDPYVSVRREPFRAVVGVRPDYYEVWENSVRSYGIVHGNKHVRPMPFSPVCDPKEVCHSPYSKWRVTLGNVSMLQTEAFQKISTIVLSFKVSANILPCERANSDSADGMCTVARQISNYYIDEDLPALDSEFLKMAYPKREWTEEGTRLYSWTAVRTVLISVVFASAALAIITVLVNTGRKSAAILSRSANPKISGIASRLYGSGY